MELEYDIKKIEPGQYWFDVAFFAGTSTVRDAEGVEKVAAAMLKIPVEEHNFKVTGGARKRRGVTGYVGSATVMEFNGNNPEVLVADTYMSQG